MSARVPNLTAFARRSWIVALAVLVSSVIALGLSAREQVRYTARSTWVVAPNEAIDDASDVLRSLETLERRTVVATFARLPSMSKTREDLAERLAVDPGRLGDYSLRGSVVPYTNLIRFEVEGPDAELAAQAADGLAREVRDEAISLYRIFTLREVETAHASHTPTQPDTGRNLVVGALIGLFVGLALTALPLLAPLGSRRRDGAPASDTAAA